MSTTPQRKVILRPRRKIDLKNAVKTPTMIEKVSIWIRRGEKNTKHELYFDDLSITELYTVGFCGPLEFYKDGDLENILELTAGPKGEFEGDVHGNHVFSVTDPKTGGLVPDTHVMRFSFSTR